MVLRIAINGTNPKKTKGHKLGTINPSPHKMLPIVTEIILKSDALLSIKRRSNQQDGWYNIHQDSILTLWHLSILQNRGLSLSNLSR